MTGCNVTWPMLDEQAVRDPIGALDGAAIVYAPSYAQGPVPVQALANATPEQLAVYYAPTLVQGLQPNGVHDFNWPVENDFIGRPHLRIDVDGKLKTVIDTNQPTVYFLTDRRRLGQQDHKQLTYVVWYPAHPRTKTFDIEPADIDSGVVRITLGRDNRPLFYETSLACGCYHKVFAEAWVENAARQSYGPPLKGKKFALERNAPMKTDWEVAGVVNSPSGHVAPPVVFASTGEHRVQGLFSSVGFVPPSDPIMSRTYRLAPYFELLQVPVAGTEQFSTIFDETNDHQVYGADRTLEKYIFVWIGTDDAGHPRRNDEILLHFDQSHWMDPGIYERYLRLPAGVL
jgi:hypothetical protein